MYFAVDLHLDHKNVFRDCKERAYFFYLGLHNIA